MKRERERESPGIRHRSLLLLENRITGTVLEPVQHANYRSSFGGRKSNPDFCDLVSFRPSPENRPGEAPFASFGKADEITLSEIRSCSNRPPEKHADDEWQAPETTAPINHLRNDKKTFSFAGTGAKLQKKTMIPIN